MLTRRKAKRELLRPGDVLRRVLLAWLVSAALLYTLLPHGLRALDTMNGAAAMSFAALVGLWLGCLALLHAAAWVWQTERLERWLLLAVFVWYAAVALAASFSLPLLGACVLVLVLLAVYVCKGAEERPVEFVTPTRSRSGKALTAVFAALFFAYVGLWLTCRVLSLSCPTYDMGIFTQMFHSMRTTGLPNTTLERDELLSHFAVHVSPIYYLMLPVFAVFPSAVTLELLQAAVLASAVIPLWRIARRNGFSGVVSALLCGLLLAYPAYAAGTSYDLHENVFLTPLLLWLFDCLERRRICGTVIFALLTLLVKEDAAVYVAIVGLYVLLEGLLRRDRWRLAVGGALLAGALVYFFAVTSFLSTEGDGVMTYRYGNLMPEGSNSLLSVVKTVLLLPMKAIFECVDKEKLEFLAQTLVPLLGLPLLTRRFERYVLLIPYVLLNLLSDYPYQHDVFFQYTYGSTAFLLYLTVVNLRDLTERAGERSPLTRRMTVLAALVISLAFSGVVTLPTVRTTVRYYRGTRAHTEMVREHLDRIPRDATVTATCFYTVPLADCAAVYDLQYCSTEHLLSSDYVVLDDSESYKLYSTVPWEVRPREDFDALLTENGYVVCDSPDSSLTIWCKEES